MQNNINIENDNENSVPHSFKELEELYTLPETNPLIVVDLNGNIVFMNNSFKNSFNLKEGINFFELETEPDLGFLLSSLSGSSYNNFTFDLIFSPGIELEEYEYNIELERIYIHANEYFLVIFNSQKEKRKLEERMNNLHNALDYGKVPVMITDSKGVITYATNSFEKILQTNIESIYNTSLAETLSLYLTKEELKEVEDSINNSREWTKTIPCIEGEEAIAYKELKLNPVIRKSDDTLNFVLTANDITNYILKNELAKKSENRLRSIINNISDLLLILKKKNGQLLFENANDNFCRAFSINKTEAHKKEVNSVLEGKLLEDILEYVKKFEHPSAHSVKFQYNSEGFRHYSVKITYIDDKLENERIYIVSLQDISDQYLYQEQLKKAYDKETNLNKLKTSFLENMSHEIRTPLNAILGYSEIIDESVKMSDFDTVSELTSSVKDVLHRVVNLFGNIVEVFQIDSGEAQLEREYFDCNVVLREVCNKKIKESENKGLDFNMLIDHTPLFIVADPAKLEKVIFSLVDNSIKYTESGEILVASKLVGNEINLIIADTGKGIKEHELNRMLEPFAQEEEGYFRNYEGAGLGLTVAYKLTKLMGGKFDIKSKEKKGTKITITFPFQKAPLS